MLGGGAMGTAILAGLTESGYDDVVVAEKSDERAAFLRDRGYRLSEPDRAVADADVVVIAVKPQDVLTLVETIAPSLSPHTVVISIAAGITCADIERALATNNAVVRAMPNTPAQVHLGMTAISRGRHCSDESLAVAQALLQLVGVVIEVPESKMDAVTATSGSGPAYAFYFAEAMVDAAVELGLDEVTANAMVRQTLLGAATLLATGDDSAVELRRRVSSPGGTTVAAIHVFDEGDLRGVVSRAMQAAAARSKELSG